MALDAERLNYCTTFSSGFNLLARVPRRKKKSLWSKYDPIVRRRLKNQEISHERKTWHGIRRVTVKLKVHFGVVSKFLKFHYITSIRGGWRLLVTSNDNKDRKSSQELAIGVRNLDCQQEEGNNRISFLYIFFYTKLLSLKLMVSLWAMATNYDQTRDVLLFLRYVIVSLPSSPNLGAIC